MYIDMHVCMPLFTFPTETGEQWDGMPRCPLRRPTSAKPTSAVCNEARGVNGHAAFVPDHGNRIDRHETRLGDGLRLGVDACVMILCIIVTVIVIAAIAGRAFSMVMSASRKGKDHVTGRRLAKDLK